MSESLDPTVALAPAVTLDSLGTIKVLAELAGIRDTAAQILAARIRKTWRFRGTGQTYITLRLTGNELELIRQTGLTTGPNLVRYQYLAVYRHSETRTEVTLRSTDRPPKKRSFRLPNKGRKKFRRIKLYRINLIQTKESQVAKAKTKKKAVDEDELESLEELEELEEEEPDDDDESEDEDEDEDEAPPKRQRKRKSSAKKSKSTKKSKKSKPKDEDEDEDEDDEDDEEEAPKKKSKKGGKSKKSGKKGKKGKGGSDGPGRSTKELTGGVGTQELAEAASEIADVEITGRDVRVYLRKNEIAKDEEHGRYVWPSEKNKGFVKLAKQIAAEYEED